MKVFINPGHSPNGIPDPGAPNYETGLRECDVALNVGKLVAKYLTAAGVAVTNVLQSDNLLHDSDYNQPCVVDTANASDADIFISIHCNSAANQMAQGTETLVYSAGGEAEKLANCIQKQIVTSLHTVDRGIKYRPELIVLKHTTMPAVLVELAFISNTWDEIKLRTKQDDFARAIARGVTDYELAA